MLNWKLQYKRSKLADTYYETKQKKDSLCHNNWPSFSDVHVRYEKHDSYKTLRDTITNSDSLT